ncbi:AVAST type 1 anti-phage system protein Avs1c [Marinicellulosiphila megalodicopiae]|uniref:AVAST type 1 anti-phage system protein Avs1c n=1 Tax=Marinicellulosiphila megalodicopiae TaxID=2724896 RepID=UPI003BAE3E01
MKFMDMKTPMTRSEFEHNLHVLNDKMKNGNIKVAEHVSMEGVLKVRQLPNGRIDFLSVDESARLNANMMVNLPNFDIQSKLDENSDED